MKSITWACLGLSFLGACSQQRDENRRGLRQTVIIERQVPSSTDAEAKPVVQESPQSSEVIDDRPIVTSEKILLLRLNAEADTSALGTEFPGELVSVQQVSPSKTMFYAKNNISYLAEDAGKGQLSKLTTPFIFSQESNLFVLENERFWLLDAGSIAFPASTPAGQLGQVTLYTIIPELMKNPEIKPRLLFVGPRQLILTHQNRANIVLLEGDKARVLSFDFPTPANAPLEVLYAGLGTTDSLYWFATAERLMVLKKSERGDWSWVLSPFRIELPPTQASSGQLSMMLELSGEKDVVYVGRPLLVADGKIYTSEALNLTLPDPQAEVISANFTATVKPILTNFCVGCHEGYDTEAMARLKAAAYKSHVTNKTMPPNAPLSDADSKIILDWYASIPL